MIHNKLLEFLKLIKNNLSKEDRMLKLAICELVCCSNIRWASELAYFNAKDAVKNFSNIVIYNYIVYLYYINR